MQNTKEKSRTCADPGSFVRGGPTLTTFFLVDQGREIQNITISGPFLARQPDDGPTLNAGLVFQCIRTSIAKKPFIYA